VSAGDDHIGAGFGEAAGDGFSQAFAAAGDERDVTVKIKEWARHGSH
jgi:hypothetical protein